MRIARLTSNLRSITSAARVSKSSIMRALKKDDFRLDFHDKRIMVKSAELSPGVSIKEIRGTKVIKNRLAPSGPSEFDVTVYKGLSGPNKGRWESSGRTDINSAVSYANKHAEEAGRLYQQDG